MYIASPISIRLNECTYLKGVGDVWVFNNGGNYGIGGYHGSFYVYNKLENINVKTNNHYGITGIGTVLSCDVRGYGGAWAGFYACGDIGSCNADSFLDPYGNGFSQNKNLDDCTATNNTIGFYSNNGSILTNCLSHDNQGCGFTMFYGTATYVNCIEYNNCLNPNNGSCYYGYCDTV